jgi:hypothetical protein
MLMSAATSGDIPFTEFLLSRGANINAIDMHVRVFAGIINAAERHTV